MNKAQARGYKPDQMKRLNPPLHPRCAHAEQIERLPDYC
jgi:hypothetical protein